MLVTVRHDYNTKAQRTLFKNFSCLLFRDAFYLFKRSSWSVCNRLYSVEPSLREEPDISFREAIEALYDCQLCLSHISYRS